MKVIATRTEKVLPKIRAKIEKIPAKKATITIIVLLSYVSDK